MSITASDGLRTPENLRRFIKREWKPEDAVKFRAELEGLERGGWPAGPGAERWLVIATLLVRAIEDAYADRGQL